MLPELTNIHVNQTQKNTILIQEQGSPIVTSPLATKQRLQFEPDQVIHLNIGGTHKMMTTVGILSQCKQSKLARLFEESEELTIIKNAQDKSKFEVFLDRDGPTFISMVNYLRNNRQEVPIFESTKDEHRFYRELQFWEIPDFSFLERRLKFPDSLVEIFKTEPKHVCD